MRLGLTEGLSRWLRTLCDPLTDHLDGRLRQRRSTEWHLGAHSRCPLELLNDVTVGWVAGRHSQHARNFGARNSDQQVVTIAFGQVQPLRRARAGMTH